MTPAAYVRSVIEAKIDAIPNLSLEHVHTFMINTLKFKYTEEEV